MGESAKPSATEAPAVTSRAASSVTTNVRAAGGLLAIGSLLFVVGLVFHPPPSPDPAQFMATIADQPTRWVVAHATTAMGLSGYVMAGLIVLTANSRLTQRWWTTTAWSLFIVGSLWVTTAAITEATVITRAAVDGDTTTFAAWQAFAEAHSAAFVVLALAVTAVAVNEARSGPTTTPVWAAWLGAVTGSVAIGGFILGFGLGIAPAGPVWLVSTALMSLWLLWFGVRLARSNVNGVSTPSKLETGPHETLP